MVEESDTDRILLHQQGISVMAKEGDLIFLLNDQGDLDRIPRTEYDSEDLLQALIEKYPDLLAGEQIDPDEPVRWLLVRREAGIPDAEGSPNRWSVDHLLLDQDGRPTFVEVKRSTDTRIRREIVGQMLDYAANAQVYWPTDRIRSLAADTCGGVEQLEARILELMRSTPEDYDVESFWKAVEDNLRSGRIRLLFVSDELPTELRRVIEFLNEHMSRIEVLGVELRLYRAGGMRALVPRVIGQTESARQEKGGPYTSAKTTEGAFLAACPEGAMVFFQELLDSARSQELIVSWGTKGFSLRVPSLAGTPVSLLYGFPPGALGRDDASIEFYLKEIPDDQVAADFRKALIELGDIEAGGQYTLRLRLEGSRMRTARASLEVIWDVARRLRAIPLRP